MFYDVLFFVAVFVLAVAGNMVGTVLMRLVDKAWNKSRGRLHYQSWYDPRPKKAAVQTEQDQMGC